MLNYYTSKHNNLQHLLYYVAGVINVVISSVLLLLLKLVLFEFRFCVCVGVGVGKLHENDHQQLESEICFDNEFMLWFLTTLLVNLYNNIASEH